MMKIKKEGTLLLMVFMTISFAVVFFDHLHYLKVVKQYGGKTRAQIVEVDRRAPNLRMETFATYKYEYMDTIYSREEELSVGFNNRPFLKIGDIIDVYYDLKNPQSATALQNQDFIPSYMIIVILMLACLIDIFVVGKR